MNSSIDVYCLELISHHIKEILNVNTNSKGNQSWNQNKKIYIFTISDTDVEKSCFLCGVKIPYQQFSEAVCRRFLKIVALKSFAILWFKKKSPTQVFSCEYCKIFTKRFFTELFRWLLLHVFKSMHHFKSN